MTQDDTEPNVTGETLDDHLAPATSSTDSTTVRGRFKPGNDPRRNTAGRPKKGESFAEKYMKRLDKDADALIEAHVKRAKGENVTAERAFATALAYKVGLPKQPFTFEKVDSPLSALLQRMAERRGLAVEGEFKVLEPGADEDA